MEKTEIDEMMVETHKTKVMEGLSHELLNAVLSIEGAFRIIELQMNRMRKALNDFKDNLDQNGIKKN